MKLLKARTILRKVKVLKTTPGEKYLKQLENVEPDENVDNSVQILGYLEKKMMKFMTSKKIGLLIHSFTLQLYIEHLLHSCAILGLRDRAGPELTRQ